MRGVGGGCRNHKCLFKPETSEWGLIYRLHKKVDTNSYTSFLRYIFRNPGTWVTQSLHKQPRDIRRFEVAVDKWWNFPIIRSKSSDLHSRFLILSVPEWRRWSRHQWRLVSTKVYACIFVWNVLPFVENSRVPGRWISHRLANRSSVNMFTSLDCYTVHSATHECCPQHHFRDFKLSTPYKWDLCSPGTPRSVDLYLVTEI
jgi:hypothetical protein